MKGTGGRELWPERWLECRPVSDLLDTAAAALGIPASLAQRSAAARAAETGGSLDDVLSAWAGGATVASAVPPAQETPSEPAPAPTAEAPATAVAVVEAPVAETQVIPEVIYEEEPAEALDPQPLGRRIRIATRVGAWTGAGLGLVGFLVASAFWSDTAAVLVDTGPIVQVNKTGVMIGAALVSLFFGAIVAGLSRAAAAWTNPGMQLANSKTSTAWLGAAVGLVLGVVGGAVLTGLGTPVEGSEETLIQLPVLATIAVMMIGGGVLGASTAAIPQLLGTPVAVDDSDKEEVAQVKSRLGNAVSVPLVGILLLLLLVLPFAYLLIESNEFASGGAALIAILVAGGILGFAALAGGKPEMRISLGDVLVALVGIGTVILVIVAVLLFNSAEEQEEGEGGDHAAAIVQVL